MATNKKKKTAFFIVSLDVYEFDIIVSFGQSNDEVLKSLNKVKGGKKHLISDPKAAKKLMLIH